MRILSIPARFAPFVEQTLAAMKATCDVDEVLTGEDSPWPTGTVVKDESRTGDLLIFVARMPSEAARPAFPMAEQPEPMERIA